MPRCVSVLAATLAAGALAGCGHHEGSSGGGVGATACISAPSAVRTALERSLVEPGKITAAEYVLVEVFPRVTPPPDTASLHQSAWVLAATIGDQPGRGPVLEYVADRAMVEHGTGTALPLDEATARRSTLGSGARSGSDRAYARALRASSAYGTGRDCVRNAARSGSRG